MRLAVVVGSLLVILTACGGQPDVEVGAEPPPDEPVAGTTATPLPTPPTATGTPEPEPEQPPSPPAATVTGEAGSLTLEQGSYCWSETEPDGSGSGVCADTIGPGEQTPGFGASAEAVLTFAFETDEAPDRVQLFVRPVEGGEEFTQVALDAANPTTYEVGLEPGSYYVVLSTDWPQGDASYHVRLDVS